MLRAFLELTGSDELLLIHVGEGMASKIDSASSLAELSRLPQAELSAENDSLPSDLLPLRLPTKATLKARFRAKYMASVSNQRLAEIMGQVGLSGLPEKAKERKVRR